MPQELTPPEMKSSLTALAARTGRERRAVDGLEQPVAAQHVERVGREIDDIERRGAAADLGFDRGERAVIGLGSDLDASLLGEGLEIGDLLRLPIGAAPACDGKACAARRCRVRRRVLGHGGRRGKHQP